MKTRVSFGLFLVIVTCFQSAAQEKQTITGVVTTFNKYPLSKVRLVASETKNITYTDSTGIFSIELQDKEALQVSAGGFHDKKVKTGRQQNIKINIDFIDTQAGWKNATEGGHISESVLQKAIEEKNMKKVKDYSKYTSIYELISSEIYDVRVTGNNVYLKETRSMNSNPQVLYVVDEVIVTDISYISPLYVKSIEFIDDVGASLYGSKGANGVLKIYLK